SPQDVEDILEQTCKDMGDSGNDDTYGWGRIDAAAAMAKAEELAGLKFTFPDGLPYAVNPDGGSKFHFNIEASKNDNPVDDSGKMFIDLGSGFTPAKVNDLGNNQYEGVFPRIPCGTTVHFYVSADGTSGKTYVRPSGAPDHYWTTKVLNDVGV